jgi:Cdc6-like AAA superfamily ATPase
MIWKQIGKRDKIQRWKNRIAPLFPTSDMFNVHIAIRENIQYSNSRSPAAWVLNTTEYCAWHSSLKPTGLWIQGKVGTGKTVIMSTITERLLEDYHRNESHDRGLGYFYCNARYNIDDILKSLIFQLADNQKSLEVLIPLTENPEQAHLSQDRLKMFLRQITMQENRESMIIIDGVDELRVDVFDFLVFLVQLASSSPGRVKIIISSRTGIRDIQRSLRKYWPILEVDENFTGEDIREYIDTEVHRQARRKDISDELESDIKRIVASRSKGI